MLIILILVKAHRFRNVVAMGRQQLPQRLRGGRRERFWRGGDGRDERGDKLREACADEAGARAVDDGRVRDWREKRLGACGGQGCCCP